MKHTEDEVSNTKCPYSVSESETHVVDRIERIARWFDGYSDHHDIPRALERGDEGLSAAEDDEDDEDDADSD